MSCNLYDIIGFPLIPSLDARDVRPSHWPCHLVKPFMSDDRTVTWPGFSVEEDPQLRNQKCLTSRGCQAGALLVQHGGRFYDSLTYVTLRMRQPDRARWRYITAFRMYVMGELVQDIVFDQNPQHFFSDRNGLGSTVRLNLSPGCYSNEVSEGSGAKYNSRLVIIRRSDHALLTEEFPLLSPRGEYLPALELMSDDVGDQPTVRYCCYNVSDAETQVYNYMSCHEVEKRDGHIKGCHRCNNFSYHIARKDLVYARELALERLEGDRLSYEQRSCCLRHLDDNLGWYVSGVVGNGGIVDDVLLIALGVITVTDVDMHCER